MDFTVMSLFVIIVIAIIIYIIQNIVYKKLWSKNLDVTLDFSTKSVSEGDKASLIEVVTNKKKLPLPSINIKFHTSKNIVFDDDSNSSVTDNYYRNDIFSILGNQKITRTLTFTCEKRGYYKIESADIIAFNLFLSQFFVKKIKNDHSSINSLYVYPKKISIEDFPKSLNSLIGSYLCRRSLNEDPFEFRGIRQYEPFDNMNSINWKASAKENTLMVNVNNFTSSLNVMIFLNITPNDEAENIKILEESIRIASTLTQKFILSNIHVSFKSNANDIFTNSPISIEYGVGLNKIREVDEALARIDLKNSSEKFISYFKNEVKNSNQNTLTFLISNYRKKDLCNFYDELSLLKKECLWIIPLDKNNKLNIEVKNIRNIFKWEVE